MPASRPVNCARAVGIEERPALARLRDIGMVEQRPPGRAEDARHRARRADPCALRSTPWLPQHIAAEIEQPVDIEGRGHVGLHLRQHAGRREGHGVAGALGIEHDGCRRRREPHMHAGRADDRAADAALAVEEAAAERRCRRHRHSPARPACPPASPVAAAAARLSACACSVPSTIGGSRRLASGDAERVEDVRRIVRGCGNRRR